MTTKPTQDQQSRFNGMAAALHQRISPLSPNEGMSPVYRHSSLLEIARDLLDMNGVNTRNMSRMELAAAAIQTRSMGTFDFPSLLANVAQRRLSSAWGEIVPSYVQWARKAMDANNFKPIEVVQLSSAPNLLQTNEHGEFQYGALSDSGISYSVATYGRIVSITRQALVNDDLRGFERLIQSFVASARRLESRLVYAQLMGDGLMPSGHPLYAAPHANLATGVGSQLSFDSLSAGRTAMRLQKGGQGELLDIAPKFLIVPAELEQTAYQLTSAAYTPATADAVNEFRAGGKTSITPVIEPLLSEASASAWFLAANHSLVDTVEYCYLSGTSGPVIETQKDFSTDGVSMRCALYFGAKAIDHRGLYKGAGQ
jgi:hypothetical protein